MGDHEEHGAGQGNAGPNENAQDDEPEVGHRRERYQPKQVLLPIGRESAPEDGNHGEDDDNHPHGFGRCWKHEQQHRDHAVGSDFVEDADQHDRGTWPRLSGRIRQPSVDGHHRRLDRKCDEDRDKDRQLPPDSQLRQVVLQRVEPVCESAGAAQSGEHDDYATKHDQPTKQRVDQELQCRTTPVFAPAEPANHEEHGDQHCLESNVEHQQVIRRENHHNERVQHHY